MKESYVKLSIDDAIEMYHSGNEKFKKIALDAFGEIKLNYNFRLVKTLEDACNALDLDYKCVVKEADSIANFSKSSAAMFKLNIVKKALNLNRDLHFTNGPKKSYIYYPFNLLVSDGSTYYEEELNSGEMEIIGKIKSEGEEYNVLGGYAFGGNSAGLGFFYSPYGVGHAYSDFGLLGCANKEIAKHLGKYFGMLITEAKYGDMVDFEILDFVKTKNADEKEYSVECSMTYNGHVKVNAESQEDAIEKAERLMDSKYGDDFPNYGKFGLVTFKFSDATADSAYEV